MGTHFYHVTVMERSDADVIFALRLITGERSRFGSDESFALMLLYDPIGSEQTTDAPLAGQFTLEDLTDPDWLDTHVDEYIESAELGDVQNLPITADLEAMTAEKYRAFFESSEAPTATFRVTARRPEWVQHLHRGMEWDSAAYDALA
jgi:hypothetical protein